MTIFLCSEYSPVVRLDSNPLKCLSRLLSVVNNIFSDTIYFQKCQEYFPMFWHFISQPEASMLIKVLCFVLRVRFRHIQSLYLIPRDAVLQPLYPYTHYGCSKIFLAHTGPQRQCLPDAGFISMFNRLSVLLLLCFSASCLSLRFNL